MASQRGLTESDQRILSEPYNPLYNLFPAAPVLVKQYGLITNIRNVFSLLTESEEATAMIAWSLRNSRS